MAGPAANSSMAPPRFSEPLYDSLRTFRTRDLIQNVLQPFKILVAAVLAECQFRCFQFLLQGQRLAVQRQCMQPAGFGILVCHLGLDEPVAALRARPRQPIHKSEQIVVLQLALKGVPVKGHTMGRDI